MEKVFKVKEVAERYGVSKRTVWEWIRFGKLHAYVIGGRNYRIGESALQEFEQNRNTGEVAND